MKKYTTTEFIREYTKLTNNLVEEILVYKGTAYDSNFVVVNTKHYRSLVDRDKKTQIDDTILEINEKVRRKTQLAAIESSKTRGAVDSTV